MRNRFVKVERVAWKDGHVSYRYRPMELRNGNTYDLGGSCGEQHEAFAVIDAIEARESAPRHQERCDCKACRPELYVVTP